MIVSSTSQDLHLSGNYLGDAGVAALSGPLGSLPSLKRLYLQVRGGGRVCGGEEEEGRAPVRGIYSGMFSAMDVFNDLVVCVSAAEQLLHLW